MSSERMIRNNGVGNCPVCNEAIDYGDYNHSGDTISYDCWCVHEECGWYGREMYDLTFVGMWETVENREVRCERNKKGNDSSSQWDGESN